jgi:tRNA (cmo5U34)-methyltransferase
MATQIPSSSLREDWSDERWVAEWIERQDARAAQRNRQFAMLRAVLPFAADESFSYINVGSGPGPFDEILLRRYPRARAILVDVSPLMLERAAQLLGTMADRARYVQADLSLRDWAAALDGEEINAVVSCIAIHNLREPALIRGVYADCYRLLTNGGVFFNFDYVRMAAPELHALGAWAGSDAEGGFAPGGGGSGMPGTTEEQVGWLREAGFSPADCFYHEFRIALFGGCKGTLRVPAAR